MAAGGKAINLGELAIAIALKTGALEAGLKQVQNQLKDHGKKVQATGADYDKLAIVAGVAFWKISAAIGSGVKAFNDFNNSMVGLKSVVQGTGNDFSQAQKFIDGFIKDGLVPANNAAMALKNLLSHGMSMDQAAEVMNRFKDSAAFARQGSLSMGEAIQGATEGLKNSLSMMVDNAGVTENLSIMWEKYAKTIGKTAMTLTDAEKVQAEYTGVMRATQLQVGDAAKYSEQFAGAQSRATFETTKLQQALGGAVVPTLNELLSIITPIISALTSLVKSNPELVAGVALSATAFLGLVTAMTALSAGAKILAPAIKELGTALTFLEAHPAILVITALAIAFTTITTQIRQAKKAQEDYTKALAEYNRIAKEGITKSEIPAIQDKIDKLKELQKQYDETNKKLKEAKDYSSSFIGTTQDIFSFGILPNPGDDVMEYKKQIEDITATMKSYGVTQETINKVIADYEKKVKEANRTTADEITTMTKDLAQKRVALTDTQNLIKAYKSAETGSKEWYAAQQDLANQFPQFSTASGIQIDAIQDITDAQDAAIKAEWESMKVKIAMSKIDLQNIMAEKLATLERLQAEQDLNDYLAQGIGQKVTRPFGADNPAVAKAKAELRSLRDELGVLDAYSGLDISKVLGIKPAGAPDFKTYENAALDSALKIHDHKVALEQLSKEQELTDLQTILKTYAKTADERMSLEERIFQVKQELRDKDLAATQKAIDDEAKKLAGRTSNSERWIDREKSSGNLTGQEEIAAYNRIIKYHKEYLAKIIADTKISQDEKNKIITDETQYIQDQQDKILSIQKATVEKAVNAYIDAKKKQYDAEEELEDDRLNKKLKDLDKEYSDKANALKAADRSNELQSLYAEERKYQNAATKEGQDKLKDIRSQIATLSKEAVQDSLDAEKATRQAAIEQEIEDNQDKYKKLNEGLETEKNNMLAAAVDYAAKANDALVTGQTTIANSLATVMKNFDIQTTDMITKGMESLKKLIEGYQKIMDGIKLSPNFLPVGAGGVAVASVNAGKGNSVVINDYGNKILSGIEDIQDYGKELLTGAENAVKG